MMRAEMSICPGRTPWRAHVGSAWCRLCHDSPMDSTASGQKFRDRSRERNGRLPIMWQIELMDHVTWLEIASRTSPPQKKPVITPTHDHEMSPPSTAGSNRLTATQTP